MEMIDCEDVALVNTFSRLDLMKEKTRELSSALLGKAKADDAELLRLLDEYDLLAMDWVYSDRLLWEGSLPDKQAEKILEKISS